MGVWGPDIFDDDLAKDIKEEFEHYLMEGMDEAEAIDELISSNDNLLEDLQDMGTFILTVAMIARENEVSSKKVTKLLKSLHKKSNYWETLKEDSPELYEVRKDLLRELL